MGMIFFAPTDFFFFSKQKKKKQTRQRQASFCHLLLLSRPWSPFTSSPWTSDPSHLSDVHKQPVLKAKKSRQLGEQEQHNYRDNLPSGGRVDSPTQLIHESFVFPLLPGWCARGRTSQGSPSSSLKREAFWVDSGAAIMRDS